MKKEGIIIILLISILLFSTLVSAYSFVGRAVDDVGISLSSGDKKAERAMDARENEIDAAINNIQEGNTEKAIKNLERAKEKLEIVQEQASPEIAGEVKANAEGMIKKVTESREINPGFSDYLDEYINEEEKTKLSAEHSEKLFEYCEELAKQDYELMLDDEKCNPDNAPVWLGNEIDNKIGAYEEESAKKMLEIFTTCMSDPRECDCSEIPIASEKTKCEKGKALAIRCEFQNDESACRELDKLDIEIPSNLPKFLRPLFQQEINNVISKKEKEMMGENAPPECVQAGITSREECEAVMMEKYAPRECIEAGATTKEECDKIMFSIHGPPPTECTENGEYIGDEACNQKMVRSGMIPEECIKDGKSIPEEECKKIMEEKGLMEQPEMQPPPECEGLSKEECNKLMEEKGMMPGMQITPSETSGWRSDQIIPQACVGMTFQECEDYLMGNHMPQECVDAGALTPEDCERVMLPGECKQAGALTPEECGAIMIKKGMPQECQDAEALNPEKCAKLMSKNIIVGGAPGSEVDYLNKKGIIFDEIPDVCVSGPNFIRGMECDEALAGMGITLPPPSDISNIPSECIKDGIPVSPQECQEILGNKLVNENIPGSCREAGIKNPDECGRFIEKQKRNSGMGMMGLPPECYAMSVLECKIFMDEHGMEKIDVAGIMKRMGKQEQVEQMPKEGEEEQGESLMPETEIKKMPKECMEMDIEDESSCEIVMSKINEERIKKGDKMIVDDEGNEDYISNDEINKIAGEAEREIEEYEPDLDLANEIKEEVEVIEDAINTIETSMTVDEVPKTKDNEDVSPAPNVMDNDVAPGPEGIVGQDDGDSSSDGGESSSGGEEGGGEAPAVTGETVREIKGRGLLSEFFDRIFNR